MKLYLEGSDLIGKTSACAFLKPVFPDIKDRHKSFTNSFPIIKEESDKKDYSVDKSAISNLLNDSNKLFIVLYADDESIIEKRKKQRKIIDEFDLHAEFYNTHYRNLKSDFYENDSVAFVDIDYKTVFETASEICSKIAVKHLDKMIKKDPHLTFFDSNKSLKIKNTNFVIEAFDTIVCDDESYHQFCEDSKLNSLDDVSYALLCLMAYNSKLFKLIYKKDV